jgi:2-(1,2-epoxy-1,2-dihydrophenyl)acetyl-CoA isomerase
MTDAGVRCFDDAQQPHLRWIVLDRPQARNAWTDEMLQAFGAGLDAADADANVRVVAITGEGSAFSAGGDLKSMRDRSGMFQGEAMELRGRYRRGIQAIPRRLARFDKPVIAAINGPAIGAGLDLACMADLRIASERACFGSTFVKVGLIPGDGGAALLARVIGLPRALDLVLTGRILQPDEALAMGLVNRVVAAEDLEGATRDLATLLANNPPISVQLAKSAVYRSQGLPLEDALELAATYQALSQLTEDHQEGVAALLERRDPHFSGR